MKTHQVPIDAFSIALKMMQEEDIDQDETECIIANLIYEGKIKGYISHQHQKLVVSKKDAFPPLASAIAWKIATIFIFLLLGIKHWNTNSWPKLNKISCLISKIY